MPAYYNEFDPFAAEWLKKLIDKNLIAKGDVDVRSITEVQPDDLKGYTQCHFFAGIGGWSYALRLAGWDDSRPVWTGSCPCQSFSTAGKQKGKADERHLWPVWFRLIRECRPATVFGEQVAAAITHEWLDEVATDVETEGYAFGSAVLPACSVGAPHRRDRLWFVANAAEQRLQDGGKSQMVRSEAQQESERLRSSGFMANTEYINDDGGRFGASQFCVERSDETNLSGGLQNGTNYVGNTSSARSAAWLSTPPSGSEGVSIITDDGSCGLYRPWSECEWVTGHDQKSRPVKSGLPLLAHGVSNRVGKLRGYGNAIVPQVAAEFIKAADGA